MRRQGTMRTAVNPNREMSMLKQELIEHYKGNPAKAWALINGIESNNFANISNEQRVHYDAAVIAMRGYPTQTNEPKSMFTPPSQASEMDKLRQAGWQEFNKPKQNVLLHEKI
jgi:hypothetical protein